MKFLRGELDGVWIIELEKHSDERGYFARTWCVDEFQKLGLNARIVQCNTSFNSKRGTLRGMHFQAAPHGEAKLIRCTRGAIYDVALDLRRNSPTFKRWTALELNATGNRMLYIPEGFAHGFQSLEDESEISYQMSDYFHPVSSRGIRWDDPEVAIRWPIANPIISQRDRDLPLLRNLA
ncbi:MAG TPA: dTDP-4-dehydrorhamnose 3,5-epimerase [Verrucomicrobiae bacterium]